MSGVYVISADDVKRIKIGRAGNLENRLRQIQTGCPSPIRLVLFRSADADRARRIEAHAHAILCAQRIVGEWFEASDEEGRRAVETAFAEIQGDCAYGAPTISPEGFRFARMRLGWSMGELARRSRISAQTVNRFEGRKGRAIPSVITAMQRALEDAGVIFLAAGETADGGPGVRLKATA